MSDGYLEMSYSSDEPNPLTVEGAGPCWFVMDGERRHGTVVVRNKVERNAFKFEPEFELYFIPDPA